MGKRTAAVVAILGILVSLVPSKALASTGPYTFPFFDHQNFVTGPWAPTANPPHLGIDYSLGYELVASANAFAVTQATAAISS